MHDKDTESIHTNNSFSEKLPIVRAHVVVKKKCYNGKKNSVKH